MKTKILCTLGPSSLNERTIVRLTDLGAALFRINLSHTSLADLPGTIELIQRYSNIPICLDTEGAQIRTGSLVNGKAILVEHNLIRAGNLGRPGDTNHFSFYPDYVANLFEVGDFISIDFNAVLVQVISKETSSVTMRVLNGGTMGQNKAVSIDRPINLPALTRKDHDAIAIGNKMGIKHFALSFANCGEDVDLIRELCAKDSEIISKIECLSGLMHLTDIVAKSDAILIDRGDLSREIPIEKIPLVQHNIISRCNLAKRNVYVATNLLESMIESPGPTRAEVNDVISTLTSGANGLVLAAETAIGANPIACANMIVRLIKSFESSHDNKNFNFYKENALSLLIPPHGDQLVNRLCNESIWNDQINTLRKLTVGVEELMDCEQIAIGTYSPLTGFMNRETAIAVLRESKLPNSIIWTIPILLPLNIEKSFVPQTGERLVLCDHAGVKRAMIDVTEVFELDLDFVSKALFGTNQQSHPGVARLMARGNRFIGGPITMLERAVSPYRQYELTPLQTRSIFTHKGWTRVVGFHTRNPAHRVHEYLQLEALKKTHSDGLFISPVLGPKKEGDFLPNSILASYQLLINLCAYPAGKVLLGGFSTYSRFAGPREAAFTAICRKNMGCSHFIVGRDHAGVGDFYAADAIDRYLEEIGDLGIELVRFPPIVWDDQRLAYAPIDQVTEPISISGTTVRKALRDGIRLPEWFMRTEIQDMFLDELKNGQSIFS